MARQLYIKQANYINDFVIDITFNDETKRQIDFKHFLQRHPHPQYNKYQNPDNFKSFYIDHGNIVWGDDWDLMFPIEQLYKGKITQ
ncbi:hypothetical protein FACS1894145_2830 [Bacteroidia bacterium]|nr:hypothetical protein FACS1894145_2830 [Bacteroidia bacterium]